MIERLKNVFEKIVYFFKYIIERIFSIFPYLTKKRDEPMPVKAQAKAEEKAKTETVEEVETTEEETEEELSNAEQAAKITRNYTIAALVPAAVPVPLADLALLTSIQLKMLHSLGKVYEVTFSKELSKKAIASLIGGVVPVSMAPSVASVLKSVPVVGQVSGTAAMLALAPASTYAIGRVFTQHFELGGNFLNFDPEAVKESFAAEFEKGKVVAEELKASTAK